MGIDTNKQNFRVFGCFIFDVHKLGRLKWLMNHQPISQYSDKSDSPDVNGLSSEVACQGSSEILLTFGALLV